MLSLSSSSDAMAMLSAAGARTFDMDTGNAVEGDACPLRWWCRGDDRAWVRSCRFVTHAGNARSFPLCSLDIMIMAAVEAYAGFRVGDDS